MSITSTLLAIIDDLKAAETYKANPEIALPILALAEKKLAEVSAHIGELRNKIDPPLQVVPIDHAA